jgi:hypothetical protein
VIGRMYAPDFDKKQALFSKKSKKTFSQTGDFTKKSAELLLFSYE